MRAAVCYLPRLPFLLNSQGATGLATFHSPPSFSPSFMLGTCVCPTVPRRLLASILRVVPRQTRSDLLQSCIHAIHNDFAHDSLVTVSPICHYRDMPPKDGHSQVL